MTGTDTQSASGLDLLRREVPAHLIGKLPRVTCADCRKNQCQRHQKAKCPTCEGWLGQHIHLDYVGHAETTSILLDADPGWSWEPLAFDERGLPAFDADNGLWIKLTVCGVTRLGYGTADNANGFKARGDLRKEIIGDALRNAAMRFGLALNLWAKTDIHERAPQDEPEPGPVQRSRGGRADGWESQGPARPPQELTVGQAAAKMRRNQQAQQDDPWSGDPAVPVGEPRPATDGQRQKLAILIAQKRGVSSADRGGQRAVLSGMLERPVPSFTALTFSEAHRVVTALEALPDRASAAAQADNDGAPAALAPNRRNGGGPQLSPELFVETLGVLVQRAGVPGGVPVYDQLYQLIADAKDPRVLERLFEVAVQAQGAGHLRADQFRDLDQLGRAANEDMARTASADHPSWAERAMTGMEQRADQMAGAA